MPLPDGVGDLSHTQNAKHSSSLAAASSAAADRFGCASMPSAFGASPFWVIGSPSRATGQAALLPRAAAVHHEAFLATKDTKDTKEERLRGFCSSTRSAPFDGAASGGGT